MIGKDIADFHRICAQQKQEEESENPFACMLSKHSDGNHSKSWFDGGVCAWCFQT